MKYQTLADKGSLDRTVTALNKLGYSVVTVKNKVNALEEIGAIIPDGSTVMSGSSVTLEQIGFKNYLESKKHPWVDLHANVTSENNPEKRARLRKESVLADYYLGSVHALTEKGEAIIASNTGSQLPHIVFTSQNIIFVVSTKKIVLNIEEGMSRLEQHVIPLEDEHMKELYNVGTAMNKVLIFKGENQMIGRKITYILIEEDLGF